MKRDRIYPKPKSIKAAQKTKYQGWLFVTESHPICSKCIYVQKRVQVVIVFIFDYHTIPVLVLLFDNSIK
jgi:hypothetical protein